VRGVLVGIDLFPLQIEVALDLVLGEHVARKQEIVVVFQRREGLAQRATDGLDVMQLFRRQIVEVPAMSSAAKAR